MLPKIIPTSPIWSPMSDDPSSRSPIDSFMSHSPTAPSTHEPLSEINSTIWKAMMQPLDDELPTSPVRNKVPTLLVQSQEYTSLNENDLRNGRESLSGALKPLPIAQKLSYNQKPTSNAPTRRDTYTLPSLTVSSYSDRNSWGLWGESPPSSPNKYRLGSNPFSDHSGNPFVEMMNNEQSDIYNVVVGPRGSDNKNPPQSIQDHNTYVMEMRESRHNSNVYKGSENINKRGIDERFGPTKSNSTTRKPVNALDDQFPMTITLRKSGSFQTCDSSGGTLGTQRKKYRPVKVPKSPYGTGRPQRNALSAANTLKKNPFILRTTSLKNDGEHNLPEYVSSKSKMSFMIPHSLTSAEYRKNNFSVPDLTERSRNHNFNEAFRKNNMTVPDFTRIDSISKGKKADFHMAIMQDADLDPSKVTKFSIDPFDESESNELFKPGSPWMHMPHLDEFIQSLPPTEFSYPKDLMTKEEYEEFVSVAKSTKCAESLFPPMNQIPKGTSLEDLKANTKAKSTILGIQQNDIIATAIDGVLGAEGSQIGMNYMRLEIIRDFVQFLALALTFGNSEVVANWVKTLLDTMPNILSLNWYIVFGNGIAFFLLFCCIAFGGLYWFRMMTKWDPNSDVEGLESSPWNLRPETKRRQNMAIVFTLTTLYLPLSKLCIDALFWSDSFWPISNPYKKFDNPDFGNAADNLRDPKDFCYVTSMRKGDWNFSPIIIGISLFTLGVLTFWFPVALKRLVDKNFPRIDKYNDVGEGIVDKNEEYRILLEKDICPYNFLYNGYSEKWAAYKTFIMANKFFNIFLVSAISKDNCLFRSAPRVYVETIRQGLQISLMVILFIIHWRSEPFLYPSQNTGEYWSRLGYVLAAILGIFIVRQTGPYHEISIALIVINCIFFVIVVWYVVRETDKYHYIVKKFKKRLDFSLNIYSPKLDFSKHIKRRIWQETWTTLLLTDKQFKMPSDKIVAYSQSPYRPPYLLNFSGSVAERHVENLKIIRQIGIRQYISSLAPLPKSLLNLRAKIVENFVGPDMYYAPEFLNVKIKTCFGKAYVVPFPFSVVMCYDEDESVLVLTQEWEIQRYVEQNENKEVQRRRLVRHMIRALEGKMIVGPCCYKNEKKEFDFFEDDEESEKFCCEDNSSEVHYHSGLLSIKHNQRSRWQNHNMNSGFEVSITYTNTSLPKNSTHERTVSHDVIGITSDFQMTPQLERLFTDNYEFLSEKLYYIQKTMREYREHYRDEARKKEETLSYGFFMNIYDNDSIPFESLPALLMTTETNPLLYAIPETEYPTLVYLYERMKIVNTSRVHQWWFLFWEDLWRKNHMDLPNLQKYPQDFSPAYRTSLCYRPMVRLDLETFLEKRGMWKNEGKNGFLHSGVLNRIYLYLNNVVFGRHSKGGNKNKINKDMSGDRCISMEDMQTKWSITKGNTIDDNSDYNMLLGKVRRTMRERMLIMKDLMMRKKHRFPRTRPFFVLVEEETENDDADSDGFNSASDEETWF